MKSPYGGAYLGRPPFTGKVSREQAVEMVRRYDRGEKVSDIAADFGVSTGAVNYRVQRMTVLHRDRPVSSYDLRRSRGEDDRQGFGSRKPVVHGSISCFQTCRKAGVICGDCHQAWRQKNAIYKRRTVA